MSAMSLFSKTIFFHFKCNFKFFFISKFWEKHSHGIGPVFFQLNSFGLILKGQNPSISYEYIFVFRIEY